MAVRRATERIQRAGMNFSSRAELVHVMRSIGNELANSVWEANVKTRTKPSANCSSSVEEERERERVPKADCVSRRSRSERERWIREKYEQKLFLAPWTIPPSQIKAMLSEAITEVDLPTVIFILAHRKFSTEDLNSSLLHLAASQGNVTILQLLLWVRSCDVLSVGLDLFFFVVVRCRSFRSERLGQHTSSVCPGRLYSSSSNSDE